MFVRLWLVNFLYLSLGLSSKILLELVVGLVGGVVGGQEEGNGVPDESLVMEGGGAGLAHGPQQTGVTIRPGEVSHAALEAGVESRPRALTSERVQTGVRE